MKAVITLFLAGALVASVGCSAKPSPEAEISCGAANEISFSGPGIGRIMVQKSVQLSDTAAGGEVPGNGLIANVVSPIQTIQICKGDCVDGSGDFAQDQEVETDIDALLIYTLELDASVSFTGSLIESFNATSQCTTDVSVGA